MSRRASPWLAWVSWVLPAGLSLAASPTGAQTIADYSRAQRTLLETTMAQAAARSAGLGASAPAVPAPASSSAAAAATAPLPSPRLPAMPAMPAVQVSGVFASSDGVVAEVVVNATPYLLVAGQGVPGTAWHVESVAVDRVVLGHRAGGASDAEQARKVFAFAALR